jgi:hypothetical protein
MTAPQAARHVSQTDPLPNLRNVLRPVTKADATMTTVTPPKINASGCRLADGWLTQKLRRKK